MQPRLLSLLVLGAGLMNSARAVTPPEQIKVPPGFQVELLREGTKADGSWICLAPDDAGRFYISPQGSVPESSFKKDSQWGGLVRATISEKGVEQWERVPVPVGDAMGLLWAFDSLYVSGMGPEGRGIYRCKDTNGDGLPDTAAMWKKVPGGAGEHGAHGLVLGPDQKSIYLIHGNSTGLVEGIDPQSPYRNWGEDDLLPRLKDPVATFFDGIKAPYGYVLRTDENGTKWELIAGGFRNPYDIDFNGDGELFTYDSDMEWDAGLPWYRPSRVLHVVPGGEYGFREGTAKWPDWYPDSLPPVCDIGLGCPTGVKFGTAAKDWPAKYRKAFFLCDWTFGRILAVRMHQSGISYTAKNPLKSYTYPKGAEASEDVETFLSGNGLPITDVEFGKDGAMYFIVGGRGTQAALYRVRWTQPKTAGNEPEVVAPNPDFIAGKEPAKWAGRDPAGDFSARTSMDAFLLSARVHPAQQEKLLEALKAFPLAGLSDDLKLVKLRTLELSFARAGRPSQDWVKTGLEKLLASYPAKDGKARELNRELCQLLVWLSNPELGELSGDAPKERGSDGKPVPNPGAAVKAGRAGAAFHAELGRQVIEKTLALLEAAPSQEEQIDYALSLRWAYGWTPEQRARYFRWFEEKARTYKGGNSFAKFVDRIRTDALSRVPEAERAAYLPSKNAPAKTGAPAPAPRAFVKAWTLDDLQKSLDALKDRQPDLARGQTLYTAAQCAQCHWFRGGGGNVGPDLSAITQRFGRKDILEAMTDPNKVVSDQYAMITLTIAKENGGEEQVSGLLQDETGGTTTLLTDPLGGKTAHFFNNVIRKREKSNVSIMPPGLLNTLSAEEVADLLAYLGGVAK